MSRSFTQQLIGGIGRQAVVQRQKGNVSGSDGWIMIGLGVLLLPIPIIGIPLLIYGFTRLA